MTGYAAAQAQLASGELQISLRSVNHRGLDLHFHLGPAAAAFEPAIRTALKESINRGHVEIRAQWTPAAAQALPAINTSVLNRYVDAFKAAAEHLGLSTTPDLNVFLALPGVIGDAPPIPAADPEITGDVLRVLSGCIQDFNASREREGSALVQHIRQELGIIEQQRARAADLRIRALRFLQDNLRARIFALLDESGISENRIIEEAAVLADRSDVQEELTRLEVHTRELRRILTEGGQTGKRIDFLLQEMNRETNTLLSKSSGAGELGLQLTNAGLQIKAAIEKIREQALNLE